MPLIATADAEWTLFFGCLFIAFGPVASMFFIVVSKKAQLVIVAITSAFFWLLAILFSASIWQIISPWQSSLEFTLILSVTMQELFRFALYYGYTKAEQALIKASTDKIQLPLNDLTSSFAAGIGFAFMQSTMMYGGLLASSLDGRGAVFADSCPDVPVVFVSALLSLATSIVHISTMIIAFEGYRQRSLFKVATVGLLHLGASLSTMFNRSANGCQYSLPISFGIASLACFAALQERHRAH